MYQRHIQIFLTMNSVIKLQSSTFFYLCGNFFNFIQGDFHFLCQVVVYIFTKKLISPSIDDQDEYVERLSTGNSLFQNTWLSATACSMVWKCRKSHKSRLFPLLTTRMNMLNDYLLETAYFRTHGSQQLPVQWSGSAGKAINRRGLNILTVTSKIQ